MQKKNWSNWKYIIVSVGALLVVVVLFGGNYLYANTLKEDARGAFGDMFGAVNALFTGLAFAGVIVTLIMQHDELKLQREDFEKQKFEDILFKILSRQQSIVDCIVVTQLVKDDQLQEQKGFLAFDAFYNTIELSVNKEKCNGIKEFINRHKDYQKYRSCIGVSKFNYYFNTLYQTFKYIDDSSLKDYKKYEYASLVRNLLSDYELLMLFYHALTVNDNDEFKKIIEKYAIFNNLKRNELARTENDEDYNLYKESAYKYQPNEDGSTNKS